MQRRTHSFSKVTGPLTPDRVGDGPVLVIVKVAEAGYVPPGFLVRSRIDEVMFTATCASEALAAASSDSRVVSITHSERFRSLEDKI
jgi:hypothetical protein